MEKKHLITNILFRFAAGNDFTVIEILFLNREERCTLGTLTQRILLEFVGVPPGRTWQQWLVSHIWLAQLHCAL